MNVRWTQLVTFCHFMDIRQKYQSINRCGVTLEDNSSLLLKYWNMRLYEILSLVTRSGEFGDSLPFHTQGKGEASRRNILLCKYHHWKCSKFHYEPTYIIMTITEEKKTSKNKLGFLKPRLMFLYYLLLDIVHTKIHCWMRNRRRIREWLHLNIETFHRSPCLSYCWPPCSYHDTRLTLWNYKQATKLNFHL